MVTYFAHNWHMGDTQVIVYENQSCWLEIDSSIDMHSMIKNYLQNLNGTLRNFPGRRKTNFI